jgi:hypothetical protein
MNHTLIIDNFLTEEQCDFFINILENNEKKKYEYPLNYLRCDLNNLHKEKFIENYKCDIYGNIVSLYVKTFPEVNLTVDKWKMSNFMLKKFLPGEFFEVWHSEHNSKNQRIACVLIYLSDHSCGTEFYTKEVIMSKKGRLLVFPTYWTHTHRGQPCPQNKDRYIMSAYFNVEE